MEVVEKKECMIDGKEMIDQGMEKVDASRV